MGTGHSHALFAHGHSPVHELAPEAKVAATIAFVAAVAVTPRTAVWAFACHALLLAVVLVTARVSAGHVARRLAVIAPFFAFALLVPVVGGGEQTDVFGVSLSVDGLWAAFAIIAKATLGATASIALTATTEPAKIAFGLERLRAPRIMVTIGTFMLRYLDLLVDEVTRMRTAMTARGYDPRWLWQAKPIAAGAGALFVRSYERSERVHAAMLSRGFDGTMPAVNERRAARSEWRAALSIPLAAMAIAIAAWVL